jgi:hypothetical protein
MHFKLSLVSEDTHQGSGLLIDSQNSAHLFKNK